MKKACTPFILMICATRSSVLRAASLHASITDTELRIATAYESDNEAIESLQESTLTHCNPNG